MVKTTVRLEAEAYRREKHLARKRRVQTAEIIHQAVEEYTSRNVPRINPRSVGGFESGRKDLGSRAEELLENFGKAVACRGYRHRGRG